MSVCTQSTALREVWAKLYDEVSQMSARGTAPDFDPMLSERIENSLHPDRMMVFVLNLQNVGACACLCALAPAKAPHVL